MTVPRRTRLAGVAWLLLFVLVLWTSSLLTLQLPHQNDTLVHLRWAEQFLSALREGWLLPRWASASIGGLGDPTFLYYQPLFYYLTSAFALLGLGSAYALLCAVISSFLLLGCVVYVYLLRRYRNRNALLGAAFILFCPVLYFVSASVGAFPWALSLSFSVLFAVESTREQPRPARLAIWLCLICLSHLLSAMMALSCIGLARLLFAFPRDRQTIDANLKWAAGVVLGLGLASFFVYPAVTQLHLINPDGWLKGANFDWRRAFALPTFTALQYGFRWFAIQLPYALITLLLSILIVLPFKRGEDSAGKILARRLGWIAIAALVLSSELAYPLYAMLSPLQKLQFPYRFVFVALLLANIALVIQLNEGAWHGWSVPARAIALSLVLVQACIMLHLQWDLVSRGETLPARSVFMQGKFGQPEYIPAARGPEWNQYLRNNKFLGECQRLHIDCKDTVQRTHDFSTTIKTSTPVEVRLPVFAFPAWGIVVDGRAADLVADVPTGLILVKLSPGEHSIKTTWTRMPAETIGWRISGVAFLMLLGLFFIQARHDPGKEGRPG